MLCSKPPIAVLPKCCAIRSLHFVPNVERGPGIPVGAVARVFAKAS
jgi:hypothetical protein